MKIFGLRCIDIPLKQSKASAGKIEQREKRNNID